MKPLINGDIIVFHRDILNNFINMVDVSTCGIARVVGEKKQMNCYVCEFLDDAGNPISTEDFYVGFINNTVYVKFIIYAPRFEDTAEKSKIEDSQRAIKV